MTNANTSQCGIEKRLYIIWDIDRYSGCSQLLWDWGISYSCVCLSIFPLSACASRKPEDHQLFATLVTLILRCHSRLVIISSFYFPSCGLLVLYLKALRGRRPLCLQLSAGSTSESLQVWRSLIRAAWLTCTHRARTNTRAHTHNTHTGGSPLLGEQQTSGWVLIINHQARFYKAFSREAWKHGLALACSTSAWPD